MAKLNYKTAHIFEWSRIKRVKIEKTHTRIIKRQNVIITLKTLDLIDCRGYSTFTDLGFKYMYIRKILLKKIALSPNSLPYPNQTLKTNFSKSPGQKLKVKLYSDRARLSL